MVLVTDRQTKVVLSAQVAGYVQGFEQATRATKKTTEAAQEAEQAVAKQHQAMTTAGAGLVAVGAAALAATGLAVKAALDWESAWAGVTKTVDGTPAQMNELEESLRGLARELPSTHEEIAAVAEAAGQLGVQRDSITDFTRVMINLGETTNLSADEAATSIAQLMNVMGTAPDQVENLGSALVALGNDGASTEAEIISMAQRLAGVGKLIGASEADILAMSNAMASVGISAELGGGAMSRVLQDIYAALSEGGDKAQAFADVAGMSAQDFASAFETDPIGAMNSFILGLNDVESSGGNVIGTLSELGIKSTEEVSTLLRLKGASDLLSDSLDLGAKAWDENNALQAEAEKRYETTAAKLEIARNGIYDAAITFGDTFLPAVSAAATAVADIAAGFGALPAPVIQTTSVLVALAAITALSGGAFLLAVPKIAEYSAALTVLSSSNIPAVAAASAGLQKATAAGVSGLSKMAAFLTGPYGIALVAAGLGVKLLNDYLESLKASTEEYQNVIKTGTSAAALFEVADEGRVISRLDEATSSAGAFQEALNKINTSEFLTGLDLPAQQLRKSLKDIGSELAKTAQSDLPAAQAAFSQIADEMELSDYQMIQLINSMPEYRDALVEQASAAGFSKDDHNLLKLAQEEAGTASETAAEAITAQAEAAEALSSELESLIDIFNELNGLNSDAVQSNAAFQESLAGISEDVERQKDDFISLQKEAYEEAHGSLDGYVESLDGFSLSLDENTAAGASNAASLTKVADAARAAAEDQYELDLKTMSGAEATEKYAATLADQRSKFEESTAAAGYNADQVKALADRVFQLPSSKEIRIMADKAAAQQAIDNLIALNSGRVVRIAVRATNESPASSWTGGLMRAEGGPITGVGGPKQDNIPVWASVGEHMLDAEDVSALGGHAGVYALRAALDKGIRPMGVADGGRIDRFGVDSFADGGTWDASRFSAGLPSYGATPVMPEPAGPAVTVNQEIHPSRGMSESELANKVRRDAQRAWSGR